MSEQNSKETEAKPEPAGSVAQSAAASEQAFGPKTPSKQSLLRKPTVLKQTPVVGEKPKDPQSKVGVSKTSPLPNQTAAAKEATVPKAATTKRPANRNAEKTSASKHLTASETKPKQSNAEAKGSTTRNAILLNPTIKIDINAPDPFNAKNEIKRTFYNDKN